MSAIQRCCVVLWGEQCDEVAAVLFVTTLRAVGLRVWIVGISGRRNNGAHGLALVTDMALDEALLLAPQTVAVIIPGSTEQWEHFLNDPRLVEFLVNCARHRAHLLTATSKLSVEEILEGRGVTVLQNPVAYYPVGSDLHTFAEHFAIALRNER